jgi:hypothetical protein
MIILVMRVRKLLALGCQSSKIYLVTYSGINGLAIMKLLTFGPYQMPGLFLMSESEYYLR